LQDIRGDLHSHTHLTDGKYSLTEMALAAKNLGYEYLAITDHSKRLAMVHGLDEKALQKVIAEIDKLNAKNLGITILKGIEVDILEDGTLDLADYVLEKLDIVVASVHHKFNLSQDKQTNRILRALDNKYVNILGHPTGRLLNERAPYEIALEKILQRAKEYGCVMELNAHPARLDLNDVHCKLAKDMGVKIAISTDAHSIYDFSYMRFGIWQARRGWLEAKNVINTYSLANLRKILNRAN
jgi:DNA polymerase (family X)